MKQRGMTPLTLTMSSESGVGMVARKRRNRTPEEHAQALADLQARQAANRAAMRRAQERAKDRQACYPRTGYKRTGRLVIKPRGRSYATAISDVARYCQRRLILRREQGSPEPYATWHTQGFNFRISVRIGRPGIYVLSASSGKAIPDGWEVTGGWTPVGAWDSIRKAVEAGVEYTANGGAL